MNKVLWLLVVTLLTPIAFSYPLIFYETSYTPTTKFIYIDNYASCEDTDIPSYNPFMRGLAITRSKSYWEFPISQYHEDHCKDIFLLEETYCINNVVKKVIINCEIFGDYACYGGECVYTGFIPGWDAIPHSR